MTARNSTPDRTATPPTDRAAGRLRWPARGPLSAALAHHRGRNPFTDHERSFHEATVERGEEASSYFAESGISAFAQAHGGICTFRMGRDIAIYQMTNEPLVTDGLLTPSTDANRELFGSFMGSLPNEHPDRPAKRAVIERVLGNSSFIAASEPSIRTHAGRFLAGQAGTEIALDEFALNLVAHVDSHLPGVLDLTQRPLTHYLQSPDYAEVIRGFFDLASEVISKNNRAAMTQLDMVVPFVRDLLHSNLESLAAAPDTNIIRGYFRLWGRELTHAAVRGLGADQLKELGTLLVASYDTTALSLLWTLAYLETTPAAKARVLAETPATGTTARPPGGPLSELELAVLEAVRRGGSNPTALWRRTTQTFVLHHQGKSAAVPAGTMIWLDRRRANHDPAVFPHPGRYDADNIRAILRSDRETVASLLGRGRYELNSFSMINAHRNPRKCPGRLFSVRMQAILLSELYSRYQVRARGIDTGLRKFSSMPRPAQPGTVLLLPRPTEGC